MLDWNSPSVDLLLNSHYSEATKARICIWLKKNGNIKKHVWLATSGTTSLPSDKLKLVGLSKQAILISAAAVNKHLESNKNDIWVNALPIFHVGGLGIHARAFLSQAKIFSFEGKWDAALFHEFLKYTKGT
ncbi:MAG: 2-succinylbenzoate--CoA ligase, partial [Nitrosopumilus sp.]|nr:2-succinylbenzoate--CoA ligase [Nitrosopumilus sp.]